MSVFYIKDKKTGENVGVQVGVSVGGQDRQRYLSFFHNPKNKKSEGERRPMTEQERKKTIDVANALNEQWLVEQKRAKEDRKKAGTKRLAKPTVQPVAAKPVAANGSPKGSPKAAAANGSNGSPKKKKRGPTPEKIAPLPGLPGEPSNIKKWRELVAKWSASNLSAHKFAVREGIGKASFYRYIDLFRRERVNAEGGAERQSIATYQGPAGPADRGDIVAVSLAVPLSRRDGPPQVLSVQYRDGARVMYDHLLPEAFHEHGYTVHPSFRRTLR